MSTLLWLMSKIKKQIFGSLSFTLLFHPDPAKGLKPQRRVDPKDPDVYRVPDLPVEWMSMFWLGGWVDRCIYNERLFYM